MAADGPLLVCRDLRKRFDERTAVDGISFHIGRGETYGLLGPNGAGKTAALRTRRSSPGSRPMPRHFPSRSS